MTKKITLIKKACLNMENKPLCLFIIIFAAVNIFLTLFLYTSCRGIAIGENGRFAVIMDSGFPVSGNNTVFFYDENGELVSSANIANEGRSQGEMYSGREEICFKVYGHTYYFDYSGAELEDVSESGELTRCGCKAESGGVSIVCKKRLGLEYIVCSGGKKRVHIYFNVFLGKILWLLLMSPFLAYAALNFRKSMIETGINNTPIE